MEPFTVEDVKGVKERLTLSESSYVLTQRILELQIPGLLGGKTFVSSTEWCDKVQRRMDFAARKLGKEPSLIGRLQASVSFGEEQVMTNCTGVLQADMTKYVPHMFYSHVFMNILNYNPCLPTPPNHECRAVLDGRRYLAAGGPHVSTVTLEGTTVIHSLPPASDDGNNVDADNVLEPFHCTSLSIPIGTVDPSQLSSFSASACIRLPWGQIHGLHRLDLQSTTRTSTVDNDLFLLHILKFQPELRSLSFEIPAPKQTETASESDVALSRAFEGAGARRHLTALRFSSAYSITPFWMHLATLVSSLRQLALACSAFPAQGSPITPAQLCSLARGHTALTSLSIDSKNATLPGHMGEFCGSFPKLRALSLLDQGRGTEGAEAPDSFLSRLSLTLTTSHAAIRECTFTARDELAVHAFVQTVLPCLSSLRTLSLVQNAYSRADYLPPSHDGVRSSILLFPSPFHTQASN